MVMLGDVDSERIGFDDPTGHTLPDFGVGLDLGQHIGIYLVPSQLRALDDAPPSALGDFCAQNRLFTTDQSQG